MPIQDKKPFGNDTATSPKTRARSFLKRASRDALIFLGIFVAVSLVQMVYFRQKSLPAEIFHHEWTSLEGENKKILDGEHPTLLYVFAPWCQVCQLTAPHLNDLYGGSTRIAAVAVAYESEEDVRRFVAQSHLEIPVILGGGSLESLLDVGQFPTYFLISREGSLIAGWTGYTSWVGLWIRVHAQRLLSLGT